MIALDVIVKYGVGEKATATAWGDLVRWATEYVGGGWPHVAELLEGGEKEFKERTGEALPPAYRSAKSVLKNAVEHNVPIVSDNGEPLGKTAVEKLVREARKADTPDKSVQDVMDECVAKMRKAFSSLPSETERIAMQHYVEGIVPSVWGF